MFEKIKGFFTKKEYVNTPTVLQMEATECGAASLAMILAYYGLYVPLEKVREECCVNRDGVTAANIYRAAENFNCVVKGKRMRAERIREREYPFIIHWEFNHFLVLEGFDNEGNALLNDPAVGHRRVSFEEFKSSFTGIALEIRPGENFQPGGEKYNVVKVISNKLLQDRKILNFVMLLAPCMLVTKLANPAFSQTFMDDVLSGKHPDWMFNLMLLMCGCVFVSVILQWLRQYILTKWQAKLTIADSARFFAHALRLPLPFFQQRSAGEVASRVDFNMSVADVMTGQAATAVMDILIAVFFLIMLCCYSVKLTIIGVITTILNLCAFLYVRKQLLELNIRVQNESGKEYATAINGLAMIETLKANGKEDDFFERWAGCHTKFLVGMQKMSTYNLILQFLPALFAGFNTALIMTIGGFSIMDGVMTTGVFMAFQGLMSNFQEPVNNILALGNNIQSTEMQLRRLEDVMRYPEDDLNYPAEEAASIGKARLDGNVVLEDVTFGYSKLHQPLLNKFNVTLKPGDWVALVGGSGSGKSTLAKLIAGIYEEWSGKVLLDGIERRKIPHGVICNSMSTVDQDIYLMEGTIKDNITLFDDSISQQEVVRAAKDACIFDDIYKLEGGFEAMVKEGGLNFSGGQRQRLEIARALVTNPSILILDEATSALDPITEQQVIENIRHRGCTTIVVAHRLSTIRDCDEIVVIDHGNIVERGNHKQLLELKGVYAQLVDDKKGGVSA